MYEIQNGSTFLRLSDDLEMLEYGKGKLCFRAASPFQFSWTGIPITPSSMEHRNVTVTDSEIHIDLAGFVFIARFPGNSYCRPEPGFAPDLRVRISLKLDGDDLVISSSPIENIDKGECSLQLILAQGLMQTSSQQKAQLYLPIHYGMRFDCPRNDIFDRHFVACAEWTLPVHGLFTPEGGIGLWCDDPDRDYVVKCNMDTAGTIGVQCRELYDDMANEPR